MGSRFDDAGAGCRKPAPPKVTAPVSSAELLVRSGKIGRATLPITIGVVVFLLVGLPLCAIAITVAMLALNR